MFVYSLRIQTNPATWQIWARKDFMDIVNKHDNKREKNWPYKHKLCQEPTNFQILDKLRINYKRTREKVKDSIQVPTNITSWVRAVETTEMMALQVARKVLQKLFSTACDEVLSILIR